MADGGLAKKLKLKPGARAAVINAPEDYPEQLDPLPEGVVIAEDLAGEFDWIQVFLKNQSELETLFPALQPALKPDSLLWLTFPKGTSRIQTDLTRDKGWDILKQSNLKWINLVSVNDTWSAFSLRLYKPGEERQTFR